MNCPVRGLFLGLCVLAMLGSLQAAAAEPTAPQAVVIPWQTDYGDAVREAQRVHKLLFIYFHSGKSNQAHRTFEKQSLSPAVVEKHLDRYVWLKLPLDAQIKVDGQMTRLLSHPAFYHMHGRQGVAILDYTRQGTETHGRPISLFPFSPGMYYKPDAMAVIFNLPPGTLTQRTMVFAIRIHPEEPASTGGQLYAPLAQEAQSHSVYQANLGVQGHHSWDARFQRINTKLPPDLIAQEVVAESWPGEELVEAAIECVHSWRRSEGHWSAVRQRHPVFGYDMRRGRNGIWYATGLFGKIFGRGR